MTLGKISEFRSKTKERGVLFTFLFPLAVATLNLGVLSACAPKDLKVSNRGGGFTASGGKTDSFFPDRRSEYSRAMLLELSMVALEIETTIQAAQAGDQFAPNDGNDSCEVSQRASSPQGTLKIETDFTKCAEIGKTFDGNRSGKKVTFATLAKENGMKAFPTFIRSESKGLDSVLTPMANRKDSLRLKTYRFLEAEFQAIEEKTLVYRVSFESMSHYDLNLKAFTDLGTIRSTLSGLMTYDLESGRIAGYVGVEETDAMEIKVQSAREGRNGGRIVRQEFSGKANSTGLSLNPTGCALPLGLLKTHFTVKPFPGDRKATVESSGSLKSLEDRLVKVDDSAAESPTDAAPETKACIVPLVSTPSEFFAGLLY